MGNPILIMRLLNIWEPINHLPSGGLTLIVGTQKIGVFLQSTEGTPCGHLLK